MYVGHPARLPFPERLTVPSHSRTRRTFRAPPSRRRVRPLVRVQSCRPLRVITVRAMARRPSATPNFLTSCSPIARHSWRARRRIRAVLLALRGLHLSWRSGCNPRMAALAWIRWVCFAPRRGYCQGGAVRVRDRTEEWAMEKVLLSCGIVA